MSSSPSPRAKTAVRTCLPSSPGTPVSPGGHPSACFIDRLPVEILSRVFEFGGRADGHDGLYEGVPQYWDSFQTLPLEPGNNQPQASNHDSSQLSFRLTVSLVCRHWHDVAISTPSLWTTFDLTFPGVHDMLEHVETLSTRSKALLLNIGIHGCDDPESVALTQPLFQTLAPRLGTMCLSGSFVNWSNWVSSSSNITVLNVRTRDEWAWVSRQQFLSLLRSVPALVRLSLHYTGDDGDDVPVTSGTPDNFAGPIPLLNLIMLSLQYESPQWVKGLLQGLYMPALKSMRLDLPDADYSPFIQHLACPAVLPTSPSPTSGPHSLANQLEELRIESLDWDEDGLLEILYDQLNNLKVLQICLDGSSEFLPPLLPQTPPGGDVTVRVPRLETLIIRHPFRGNLSPIFEATRKRKAAGFPLKSLYIQTHHSVEAIESHVEKFSFF